MSYASRRGRGPRVTRLSLGASVPEYTVPIPVPPPPPPPPSALRRTVSRHRRMSMGTWSEDAADTLDALIGGFKKLNPLAENILSSVDDACDRQAETQMGTVNGQLAEAESWDPNGFYTVEQMGQLLNFTYAITEPVTQALAVAQNDMQLPRHRERLISALDDVHRAIGIGGLGVDPMGPFTNGLEQARATGAEIIEAPGLKRFVVSVFKQVRDATLVLKSVECARPGLLFALLAKAESARQMLINVIRTIGAGIQWLGETIVKIPDTVGTLFTVLKWGVLFGGLYFIGIKTGVVPPQYDITKRF